MKALKVAQLLIRAGVLKVTEQGEVWRRRRVSNGRVAGEWVRAECRVQTGYLAVRMNWRGRAYLISAARLVWEILVGPIPRSLVINHKNGKKDQNTPGNLEVVTQGANMLHSYEALGRKPAIKNRCTEVAEPARALRREGMSYSQIARALGVSQTLAYNAVRYGTNPGALVRRGLA